MLLKRTKNKLKFSVTYWRFVEIIAKELLMSANYAVVWYVIPDFINSLKARWFSVVLILSGIEMSIKLKTSLHGFFQEYSNSSYTCHS